MTLVIRPLAPTDKAEWRRMWTAYLVFYEANLPDDVYETTFARLLPGGSTDLHGLIARHAEETGSLKARAILAEWGTERARFVQVCPREMLAHLPVPLEAAPQAVPAE